ncbi:MAG TPA: hypothetical protein VFA79_07085 [Myxococcales bacterium]|nr:hypothetical protein [Myxococcales bacterium]
MFIGHFALALAAKPVSPRTSLGTLFAATQLADLVWPILLLLGVETVRVDPGNTAFTPLDFASYPWTHSLLMALVWAAAFALAYFARTRLARGAWVIGVLVFSHWALDFVTHRADLPLAPGAAKVGLGLWSSVLATVLVEGALFAAGVLVYVKKTRPRDRTGRLAFWALVVFLIAVYVSNILGPPPPGARAVSIVTLSMWLFVPWGVWIDRHREPVSPAPLV